MSIYDPQSPNYIYKTKKKPCKQEFLYFGYLANCPEDRLNSILNRGVWKVLNYNLQVVLCTNNLKKKLQQTVPEQRISKDEYLSVGQQAIDESIIDKCDFVWRPLRYNDDHYNKGVNKKINRRCKLGQLPTGSPYVFNHF